MIERHFYYYCMIKLVDVDFLNDKFTKEELYSAFYGEFVREGKPELSGYKEFHMLFKKLAKKIIEKFEEEEKMAE